MSKLVCPACGNDHGWRNAIQDGDGNQAATCGNCGIEVTSKGGVTMGTATGGMTQNRNRGGGR